MMSAGSKPKRMGALVALICFIYAGGGLSALAWMSLRVEDPSQPVALVFPPGVKADESFNMVVHANGTPLRYGVAQNIIIAHFNDLSTSEIKNKTQALIVMNPIAAGSCFKAEEI